MLLNTFSHYIKDKEKCEEPRWWSQSASCLTLSNVLLDAKISLVPMHQLIVPSTLLAPAEQGSKLRLLWSPMRLTFFPWRPKILVESPKWWPDFSRIKLKRTFHLILPCTYELRHLHFTNWRLKICIWRLYFSGWSPQGDLKIFLISSPAEDIQTYKATKIHTLNPLTYELVFQNSSKRETANNLAIIAVFRSK